MTCTCSPAHLEIGGTDRFCPVHRPETCSDCDQPATTTTASGTPVCAADARFWRDERDWSMSHG